MHKVIATRSRISPLFFILLTAAVYTTAIILQGRLADLKGANAVAVSMTIDMVVLVPLAFYLLVVRPLRLSILSLAPVVVLSLLAATLVLPSDHRQLLRALDALAIPIELGLLGWIVRRALKAVNRARQGNDDPLDRFRHAACELVHNNRAAELFASEVAMFYYAFGSWRARPHVARGATPFTHHVRSGHAGIALGILLLLACEGLGVHLLLLQWSKPAAWIFTCATIYTVIWIIADYRATVLRPILVSDKSILIRAGLRWTVLVELKQISRIDRKKPESRKDLLNLTLMGTPTHWLILSEPVTARGLYGFRRRVGVIGIEPDSREFLNRIHESRSA